MEPSERESDDRHLTIRQILLQRSTNLSSELQGIEKYAQGVEKAHTWAYNPLCLVYERSSESIFRCIRNRDLARSFVAVSWTWKSSDYESRKFGKYFIHHSHTEELRRLDVRDCVLDRVLKYLVFVGCKIFWMDRLCIDQDDKNEKEEAMNSMDLIYKRATKSVALWSTPIRSQFELDMLKQLMHGDFTDTTDEDHHVLRRKTSRDTIAKLIRMLFRLTQDPWWSRAWTFQEEYVAGVDMDIMIPLDAGVTSGSGNIAGEYCVPAVQFREQVTVFMLACLSSNQFAQRRADRRWHRYQTMCSETLEIAAKYNIILSRPMSARIHADIGRRDIAYPWDSLAIAANCCGYKVRLDRQSLVRNGHSLSISLLAQFLLNGEITMSNWHYDGLLDLPIFEFLERASMDSLHLPGVSQQLTFFKNCRLPRVEFCDTGFRTQGFLWKLQADHRIHTGDFELPDLTSKRGKYLEKHPWEAMELDALVEELYEEHAPVAERLCEYIERRQKGYTWPGSSYMDLMAGNVFRAAVQGHVLRIGYLRRGGGAGIFIPTPEDISRDILVFTARQSGRSYEYGLDNHVSIAVEVLQNGSLRPSKWLWGLVFHTGLKPQWEMLDMFS